MRLYIGQSGDLDICYRCLTDDWLTHWQTLKDRATQLLIKYKTGALVTQYIEQQPGLFKPHLPTLQDHNTTQFKTTTMVNTDPKHLIECFCKNTFENCLKLKSCRRFSIWYCFTQFPDKKSLSINLQNAQKLSFTATKATDENKRMLNVCF